MANISGRATINGTNYLDTTGSGMLAEPFRTAEDAWFWTMSSLAARRDGTRSSASGTPRPCEPDDVIRCLDQLYRQRRIDLFDARVLRIWGERQRSPNPACNAEAHHACVWREAMARLEWKLRAKGIVV